MSSSGSIHCLKTATKLLGLANPLHSHDIRRESAHDMLDHVPNTPYENMPAIGILLGHDSASAGPSTRTAQSYAGVGTVDSWKFRRKEELFSNEATILDQHPRIAPYAPAKLDPLRLPQLRPFFRQLKRISRGTRVVSAQHSSLSNAGSTISSTSQTSTSHPEQCSQKPTQYVSFILFPSLL